MKRTNLLMAGMAILITLIIWGFRTPSTAKKYEWKEITTLESAVGAGFGRSRIIEATTEKARIVDNYSLENIFSATGINFDNITGNEQTIIKMITDAQNEGWELFSITSNTLNADTKRQRLFITRYLFRRGNQ